MIRHPSMWSGEWRGPGRSPRTRRQPATISHRSGAGAPSHAARAHCSGDRLSSGATATWYAQAKSCSCGAAAEPVVGDVRRTRPGPSITTNTLPLRLTRCPSFVTAPGPPPCRQAHRGSSGGNQLSKGLVSRRVAPETLPRTCQLALSSGSVFQPLTLPFSGVMCYKHMH